MPQVAQQTIAHEVLNEIVSWIFFKMAWKEKNAKIKVNILLPVGVFGDVKIFTCANFYLL